MKLSEIEIGGVYRNKKGLCRKVTGFSKWMNKERIPAKLIEGNEVEYVSCDEMGNPISETKYCWCYTFVGWARERLQIDGKTPQQRVFEYMKSLRDANRAYCADYIKEAFRLYGIELREEV